MCEGSQGIHPLDWSLCIFGAGGTPAAQSEEVIPALWCRLPACGPGHSSPGSQKSVSPVGSRQRRNDFSMKPRKVPERRRRSWQIPTPRLRRPISVGMSQRVAIATRQGLQIGGPGDESPGYTQSIAPRYRRCDKSFRTGVHLLSQNNNFTPN